VSIIHVRQHQRDHPYHVGYQQTPPMIIRLIIRIGYTL
jgi:hypothetical protein